VPVTRAKPLDSLYDEVRDYDLVIVPDAPLASGLNRRLDRAHLGIFAITPRRLEAGRREHAEDRSAFLELVTTTALEWKQAAYAIGNTLQCWEHQGRVDAVLDYDAYADTATETTVEQLSTFHLAEAYHQKHSLRGRQSLLNTFEQAGYDDADLRESPAAAKLNGYAAGRDLPEGHDLGTSANRTVY
jgi:hypothetical protein